MSTSANIAHVIYTTLTNYSTRNWVTLPSLTELTVELTEAVERVIGEEADARLDAAVASVNEASAGVLEE